MGLRINNFLTWIGQLIRGGTAGSVLFVDATGAIGQDNASLFFDDSNNRLGIGTVTPLADLHVAHNTSQTPLLRLARNTTNYVEFLSPGGTASPLTVRINGSGSLLPFQLYTDTNGGGINAGDVLCGPFFMSIGASTIKIGGTAGTNAASAKLEVNSTTQGFLPPVMTTTQKNAVSSPATGLMVYDSTLNKLSVFTGAVWETVTSV